MSKHRLILIILLVVALPSSLYAVGMGGMGGMGAVVEKVAIQTPNVGTVIFNHNVHGANCRECHPKIFKQQNNSNHVSMKVMEQGKSCGTCHNGKRAFTVAANCTRCHKVGDIAFVDKAVGKTIFPHSVHIEALGGCDSCHPDLFKAQKGADKVTMKAIREGEFCGACHDGSEAFGVTEAADCVKCHAGDVVFKNKNIGNTVFPHSVHIEALGGCDSCHPDLFKAQQGADKVTMEAMENGEFCGACHDGSEAFGVTEDSNCAKCHAGDIVFKNEDAGDVTFPHTAHIKALGGCDSCHPDLFKAKRGANKMTMEDMENGEFCGACHDGSEAFNVTEDCESCHKM